MADWLTGFSRFPTLSNDNALPWVTVSNLPRELASTSVIEIDLSEVLRLTEASRYTCRNEYITHQGACVCDCLGQVSNDKGSKWEMKKGRWIALAIVFDFYGCFSWKWFVCVQAMNDSFLDRNNFLQGYANDCAAEYNGGL